MGVLENILNFKYVQTKPVMKIHVYGGQKKLVKFDHANGIVQKGVKQRNIVPWPGNLR